MSIKADLFTDAQIKEASIKYGAPEGVQESAGATAETQAPIGTDPTIANAGLTELDDNSTSVQPTANGFGSNDQDTSSPTAIPQGAIDTGAANAVAESSWDTPADNSLSASQTGEGWVQVPRDPTETDTGYAATPAADHTNSWAEDVPTEVPVTAEDAANDGFEQVVHHNRPSAGRGRGSFRGRGRGGEGFRGGRGGSGRGRGRGGRGGEWRGGRGGRGGQGQASTASAPAPTAS